MTLGQQFYTSGASASQFDGWYTVSSVVDTTHFKYATTAGSSGNHAGLGVVQPSNVLLTTIAGFSTTSSITLAANAWYATPLSQLAQVSWATDDTNTIQNVINNALCPPLHFGARQKRPARARQK